MTKVEIQLIRSLEDKRARRDAGLFACEGEKLVRELLASGFRVRKVWFTGDALAGSDLPLSADPCRPAADMQAPVGEFARTLYERISPNEMERISHLKTRTNCLALVEIPRPVDETFDAGRLAEGLTLALDGVQNPGNMGTIIRLADWFGIRDILCSDDSADCFNPKVVQATMGAITRVKVHYGDLEVMIEVAKTSVGTTPLPVYGAALDGENIYGAKLSPKGVIVLGSEGRGISPGVERLLTRKLFIPSFPSDRPTSESLNVAIAAAIVCSEFRRR